MTNKKIIPHDPRVDKAELENNQQSLATGVQANKLVIYWTFFIIS